MANLEGTVMRMKEMTENGGHKYLNASIAVNYYDYKTKKQATSYFNIVFKDDQASFASKFIKPALTEDGKKTGEGSSISVLG